MQYLRKASGYYETYAGRLEREALLYSPNISRCLLDEDTSARITKIAALIVGTNHVLSAPELRFAKGALHAGAISEVDDTADMALCVVAVEELLMGQIKTNLTATFARRAGVVLAPEPEMTAQAEAFARALYRVRSRFLHGEGDSIGLDDEALMPGARFLLVRGILCVLSAVSAGLLPLDDVRNFGTLLDKAATAPALRQQLHETMPT
jgi:hypothetical protein